MKQAFQLDDIAIAGGGPAGTLAAILLARAGYRVGLATSLPVHERMEGLSPRVVSILRAHELPLAAIAPASQRQARWGNFEGDQNVEHLVERRAFDLGLLDRARQEGVSVTEGSIAAVLPERGVIRMTDGRRILAGLLFEARGRRAPRAVTGRARGALVGPETISIAGMVPSSGGRHGSEIAARPEGWTWRARMGEGRDWLQVVGDAAVVARARGAAARRDMLWQQVLGTSEPAPHRARISAASLRLTAPEFDPHCPRLGDAAVALDPLSGHGLFWAVSSALMAVPVARALFGGQVGLARDFYRDRVVDTFWRQARIGRDFHAAAGQDGAFWQKRCQWPDARPAHPDLDAPRLETRVLLRDGALSRGEVLVTRDDPGGAAFVLGQEIAPLLRALGPRPLPDAETFHRTFLPGQPAPLARRLHGWMLSRGLGRGAAVLSQEFEKENASCETKQAV